MKKVILSAFVVTALFAGEDGFDLAPTPVSQSQLEAGKTENMFRVTSISSSVDVGDDSFDISGFGVQFGKKDGEEGGAINKAGSIMTLSGSGGGIDTSLVTVNAALLWENYNKTQDNAPFTLFFGGDFSYTYANANDDAHDAELDLYLTTYGGTAGVQYNIHSPSTVISPFAVFKYLMGNYSTDLYIGNQVNSTSDSIDPMLTQSFGFDVYFKSLRSTLSAMVKNDSASSTTMISYAWFW